MNNKVAFISIVKKELRRIFRIWPLTLFPSAITMTLYFLIFGRFIGSQIQEMKGFSYIEFIIPGLIMMSVINNSYANVAQSFFMNKFQRSIQELLISPTKNSVIILGYATGGMIRSFIVALIVTGISLFFTHMNIYNLGWILVFVFFCSLMFCLGGLMNGVLAKAFDQVGIVTVFFLSPLTYLGGVFYSIEMLPPLFQKLSLFNPLLYIVNGFRYGFLGVSDVNPFICLGVVIIFCSIFLGANLFLFSRGIGLKE